MPLWLYQYLRGRSKPPYVPTASANQWTASGRKSNLTLNKGRIHPLQAASVIAAALRGLPSSILISFYQPNPPRPHQTLLCPAPPNIQTIVETLVSPWASHQLSQADGSLAVIETFLRGIGLLAPSTLKFQSLNSHRVALKYSNDLNV